MTFLNPTTALLVAAVTVPALLLLYFLKLRRRYMRVASTLLWERTYEDLEVNAPFQRLRFTSLLLLQLLVLAALLMALAQPASEGQGRTADRLILVIDHSASMNATDGTDTTRLDRAQEQAVDMVERLGRGAGANEVMLIAYARTASVVSSFTHDRRQIIEAIRSIRPTDEVADLQQGLSLASAFAGDSESAGAQDADIVLFSDGRVGEPDDAVGYRVRTGTFRYLRIGPDVDEPGGNVGITSFSARRDIDDPTRVLAFARLINTSQDDVDTVLRMLVDGERAALQRVTIPGTQAVDADDAPAAPTPPGEASVTFDLELSSGAVLSLMFNLDDDLPGDNVAHLVMPGPAPPRIALVHPGDGVRSMLRRAIEDLDPESITPMTFDAFRDLDERLLDAGDLYDMIVFDRVSATRLPGVPTMTFGGAPGAIEAIELGDTGGRRIASWSRHHPVMRHVSLDNVVYRGFGHYELPRGAEVLARGPEGPVIALTRTRGARHLAVGFPLDLDSTTWPLTVSIVIFLQNAMDHLTLTTSGEVGLVTRPGEPIAVRPGADVSELDIDGPVSHRVPVEPGSMRSLPSLRRAGVYTIDGAVPPWDRIAISTLSEQESDIRPREQLLVNAEATGAREGEQLVPREYWPYLVALALLLLSVEWLEYCRRVR